MSFIGGKRIEAPIIDDVKHGGLDTYNGIPEVAEGEHYLCLPLVKTIALVSGAAPPKLEDRIG